MQPSSAEDGFLLERIIIFANGELPDPIKARSLLQPGDTLICADGGEFVEEWEWSAYFICDCCTS